VNLDDRLRASGARFDAGTPDPTPGGLEDVVRRSAAASRRRVAATATLASVLVLLLVVGLVRGTGDRRIDVAASGGGEGAPGAPPGAPTGTDPTTTVPPEGEPPPPPCDQATFQALLAGLDRSNAVDRFACHDGWAATMARLGEGWEITVFLNQQGAWTFLPGDPASSSATIPAGPAPLAELFTAMGVPMPTTPTPPTGETPTTTTETGDGDQPASDAGATDEGPEPLVTLIDADTVVDPPPEAIAAAAGATIDSIDPATRPTVVGDRIVVQDAWFLSRTTARRFTDAERDAISTALAARGLVVVFADPTVRDVDPASGLVLGSASLWTDPWSAAEEPLPGGFAVRAELSYPDPDGDQRFGGQGSVVRLTPGPGTWLTEVRLAWIT
jgi:hypothetical protein